MRDPSEQLRVGIIGGGLGGLITAMDLAEAGHKVRRLVGHIHTHSVLLVVVVSV